MKQPDPVFHIGQITPAVWASMQASAATELGQQLTADSGTVKYKGITVEYSWDEGTQTFTFQVTDRDFLDPSYADIESDIQQWAEKQRGS